MQDRTVILTLFFIAASVFGGAIPVAAVGPLKLPYEKGERFIVVQGYDASPTHINKDLYALDLSQNGCDAYGKLAVAAEAGKVMLAQGNGYNGGYGSQVLMSHDDGAVVSRYAHLIPGTVSVGNGEWVAQGQPLGKIGDTGLVAGFACGAHPGTHLHFAMYRQGSNAAFSPHLVEPISGYSHLTEGKWYASDNALAIATISGATAIVEKTVGKVLGAETAAQRNSGTLHDGVEMMVTAPAKIDDAAMTIISAPTESVPLARALPAPVQPFVAIGGVGVSSPPPTPPAPVVSPSPSNQVPESLSDEPTSTISTPSSTPTSTSLEASSSTPSELPPPEEPPVSMPTSTPSSTVPDAPDEPNEPSATSSYQLFVVQSSTSELSNGSWYSGNWYQLGTGFYGLVSAITLEGFVDGSPYGNSYVLLQEFSNPEYQGDVDNAWVLSGNAPFTNQRQQIVLDNLTIPLLPDKFYRLKTYQGYQNRSVILAGTNTTGTAMADGFIYGVGRVEYHYPFYPYLSFMMVPNYTPPDE